MVAIPTALIKYNNSANEALELPLTLTNIWDKETLLKIGNTYTETFSDENTKNKLIRLIKNGGTNLELKISADFKNNNIVVINGWMLSKTEARQCALFSLTQSEDN